MRRLLGGIAAGIMSLTAAANASETVATFNDPAADATTPLFILDGNTFTGGWEDGGLDLIAPLISTTYQDVIFEMTPLVWDGDTGLSGGTIWFYEGVDLVFQIDFLSASLFAPFVFGASEFAAQDVTFSGPATGGLPLSQEEFSFSFANTVLTDTGATWTAAFTSSAIPEPSSLALLVGGLGALLGRRRLA